MNQGLKIAIKYSIVPCQLGYCGPTDEPEKKILLEFLRGEKIDEQKIRQILQQFAGTNLYYNFIARSNGITDPFDKKVVEAYWTGNELLDKLNGAGHHSFHVYKIGSITGRIQFTDNLRDLCRIGWGCVKKIKAEKIIIEHQPIIRNKNNKLELGEETGKIVGWDKIILPRLEIGNIVSIHWDKAIEVLEEQQMANLKKFTLMNIK